MTQRAALVELDGAVAALTKTVADLAAQLGVAPPPAWATGAAAGHLFAARVEAAFKLLDKNGDGTLTRGELNTALKKCGTHAHADGDDLGHEDVRGVLGITAMRTDEDRRQFELVYQQLDGDGDKRITMEEFSAYFESVGLPALNQVASTATEDMAVKLDRMEANEAAAKAKAKAKAETAPPPPLPSTSDSEFEIEQEDQESAAAVGGQDDVQGEEQAEGQDEEEVVDDDEDEGIPPPPPLGRFREEEPFVLEFGPGPLGLAFGAQPATHGSSSGAVA